MNELSSQPSQPSQQDKLHKFLVLGDQRSGKSSLLSYFCTEKSQKNSPSKTIGFDLHVKEQEKDSGRELFEFWELNVNTNSMSIYEAYLQAIIKDGSSIKGIIFFCDGSSKGMLKGLKEYLKSFVNPLLARMNLETKGIPLLIVLNKEDLLDIKLKLEKTSLVNDFLQKTFGETERSACTFLSVKSPYSQFEELEGFVEACIQENYSRLFMYSLERKKNSKTDRFLLIKNGVQNVIKDLFSLF